VAVGLVQTSQQRGFDMSADQSGFEQALALYRTTQAGLFRFWVSKAKKASADERLRAILKDSPELSRQVEEHALEKGDLRLWWKIAESQEDEPDVALFSKGIDCTHRAICEEASASLMARLKRQSEFLRNPSEDAMPILNESRDPLARVTGPTQMLLMAIDNAVHRKQTAYGFLVTLHALAYNLHVWGHRPSDESRGKPAGPLCRGAAELSIAILKGNFGEEMAECYIRRWCLMRKHTREEAIGTLSDVLRW
jgi:hypothetical protein